MLLQTAKGPAVIELEFDGLGIISKDISEVYELAPRDVPDTRCRTTNSWPWPGAARVPE